MQPQRGRNRPAQGNAPSMRTGQLSSGLPVVFCDESNEPTSLIADNNTTRSSSGEFTSTCGGRPPTFAQAIFGAKRKPSPPDPVIGLWRPWAVGKVGKVMHVTADCPHCRSRYHFIPKMRGERVRCANTACRHVFIVKDNNEPPPAKSTNDGTEPDPSGSGGEPSGT